MTSAGDNERIAILETKVTHISSQMDAMKIQNTQLLTKIDELHDIFMQAKGARWAFLIMAALGGFISAKLVPVWQYFMGHS